jgi:hypothetical protein
VRQQGGDETERRRRGLRLGDDFMERAAGQAAIGQARIHAGQAEGKSCA